MYISHFHCLTALGNESETITKMQANISGLKIIELEHCMPFMGGAFQEDNFSMDIKDGFSRLEGKMLKALSQTIVDTAIPHRNDSILIIASTKGNIRLYNPMQNNYKGISLPKMASKINHYFGFVHEPIVISNACISSLQAVALAYKLIQAGSYKFVYICGADELSSFIASGFQSFLVLSKDMCAPFSKNRFNINLSEGVGAICLSAENIYESQYKVCGATSINDAHHISGPSRQGDGLYASITTCLKNARIESGNIEYINAHGTGTVFNDEAESFAFSRAGLSDTPLNCFKGYFGHSLGAAGIIELGLSIEMLKKNHIYKCLGFTELGVSNPLQVVEQNMEASVQYFLKTNSGFGGTNAAVIVERLG